MKGRLFALAPLLAALSACVSAPAPDTDRAFAVYQERALAITAWPAWSLVGRLSLDDGEDGGSGRLVWQVSGSSSQLDFRGSLGRGSWRIVASPGGVELRRSDGTIAHAETLEQLVLEEIGWELPVSQLQYWVRGLQAPGQVSAVEYDAGGRVVLLEQDGWNIGFERYREAGGFDLPGRIEAVRERWRIKLVASRWSPPETSDA